MARSGPVSMECVLAELARAVDAFLSWNASRAIVQIVL